jgi:hypothetical protein
MVTFARIAIGRMTIPNLQIGCFGERHYGIDIEPTTATDHYSFDCAHVPWFNLIQSCEFVHCELNIRVD